MNVSRRGLFRSTAGGVALVVLPSSHARAQQDASPSPTAVGLRIDPLTDLFAVGRSVTGRKLNDDPVSVPSSPLEMHTGGIWYLLPTLADIPEGLVFQEDEAGP